MQNNKPLQYLSFSVLIVIWGTAFTLVGYTVDYISPAWMVSVRTIIAAVILVIYAHLRGHKLPPLKDKRWLWYGFMGLVGITMPFNLTATGQMTVDSGLTAILVGFMPLITIVLAHFLINGEDLTWRKSFGFFIGFVGIVFLFLPDPFEWVLIKNWHGQGLIILSAFCYSILAITAKRAPQTSASVGAAIMLISAAFFATLWAIPTGIPREMPPRSAIIALLVLTVGANAFAQILYLRVIQIFGPSTVSKINYVVPICSLFAGMLFLDEVISVRSVYAMVIIFAGLLIARSGATRLQPTAASPKG
ncbi:EamA family transporter [bacterium AH-315-J23]|nr:EamA family transporter [bacterium AH-315-J23]